MALIELVPDTTQSRYDVQPREAERASCSQLRERLRPGTSPSAATQADNTSTRQQPNNNTNTNHRANTNQNLRREHKLPAPSILQKPVHLRARSARWVPVSGLNPTQPPDQTPHLPLLLQLRLRPRCHRNPHPSRHSHPLRQPERAARQPPKPVEAAMAHRLPDRGQGRHVFHCTSSLDYAGRPTRRMGSRF